MDEYYTHGAGEYVVGEDEAREIIGAMAAQLRRAPGLPNGQRNMIRLPAPRQVFNKPPLPVDTRPTSELATYIGLGIIVFTPTGPTASPLVAEPQESFRITRLVIDTATDPSVTNAPIVTLNNATIGALNQSPVVDQPAPASMFARDATYAGLSWQVAYRNQKIQVEIGVTEAPAVGNITVVVGAYGVLLR